MVTKDFEQFWLNGGVPPRPAAKPVTAVCSCAAEHYKKAFEASPKAFNSTDDVDMRTQAIGACNK